MTVFILSLIHISEDGSFYTFNVKYAAEPLLLNVEMCDFIPVSYTHLSAWTWWNAATRR